MSDEREITAEELDFSAQMENLAGQPAIAITYRRAARTIERLEEDKAMLCTAVDSLRPHAEVGRLLERIWELSQQGPHVVCESIDKTRKYSWLDVPSLRQLVAALEAARQPEAVPAPSGARYENRGGVLMVLTWAFTNNPKWEPADSIPTVDLDHVHALMHGRAE